mgnify:CR=1 FL=1
MTGYAFYRFECALRSAAVLGFFGIPTLGYYVHQSFANAHYHEVWSYLYALFVLVELEEIFLVDQSNCLELTSEEWEARDLHRKFTEAFLQPLRPLL